MRHPSLFWSFTFIASAWLAVAGLASEVRLMRVPLGGLQPQVATDAQGTIHLVFLSGSPEASDIYYCRRGRAGPEFSAPVKVNSVPQSAMALGTIRGAQLAVEPEGRVHVVWNGSKPATGHPGVGFYYGRSNAAQDGFEPQRDLATAYHHLDGGGSIAVDTHGRVRAFWHGRLATSAPGEIGRTLVFAQSLDHGQTFAPEQPALQEVTGACACCAMRAWVDQQGGWHVFFRTAATPTERDETLLYGAPAAARLSIVAKYPWKVSACPMSSVSFAEAGGRVWAAWETVSQIQFGVLDDATHAPIKVLSPSGLGSRKHPVLAVRKTGELLVAWTEGTGWQKGGSLAWEQWDASGRLLARGRSPGVPAWSLPAVVPEADGSWTIIY